MSERRERLRAGVAMMEVAIVAMERAQTEFGEHGTPGTVEILHTAICELKRAGVYSVRAYDKEKP